MHQNITNRKRYIGITSCEPKVRWKKGFGYSERLPIGRAFRKYGWDGFTHHILATGLTEQEAKKMETQLISDYQTQNPKLGYNITSGGDGVSGWHPTKETRRKIGEAQRGKCGEKNSNYGHKWTAEKRSDASKRMKNISDERKKKLSDAAKKRTGNKNPFYGKTHTDATKERIAQCRRKPVKMFDKNMLFIREYPSMLEASKDTGINKSGISNCCRGVTQSSGGYIWQYS